MIVSLALILCVAFGKIPVIGICALFLTMCVDIPCMAILFGK